MSPIQVRLPPSPLPVSGRGEEIQTLKIISPVQLKISTFQWYYDRKHYGTHTLALELETKDALLQIYYSYRTPIGYYLLTPSREELVINNHNYSRTTRYHQYYLLTLEKIPKRVIDNEGEFKACLEDALKTFFSYLLADLMEAIGDIDARK